jgi:hypothetical protein
MSPKVPRPVSVRGGSEGVEAHCHEIEAMARRFGQVATDTGGAALSLHGCLANPVVSATAVLDPVGVATFEADLLAALDGPRGLSWVALQCGLIDTELRAAARLYQQVDELDATMRDQVGGVVQLGLDPASLRHLSPSLLTRNPALLDALMNAGLISLDGVVAGLYPDGRAKLADHGVDADPAVATPPRSLTDLLAGLARRNAAGSGAIDVRIVIGADGRRRAIVDIPGTKTFDPTKVTDITGPATNLRALVGVPTSYEHGVLQAMHRAGVRPGDDVMLVGHSEGGMVAVQTAAACAASGRFHVTHVVTAGAPIGLTAGQLPARVQVLAMENDNDVVPHLDGRTNPDRVNITTVTVHRGDNTIGTDHSVAKSYVPGAADIDASPNPAVQSYLSGARGFLTGTSVQTHTFVITRQS